MVIRAIIYKSLATDCFLSKAMTAEAEGTDSIGEGKVDAVNNNFQSISRQDGTEGYVDDRNPL
jgi:hypothetical protein